jgi:hypothetical protein
MRQLPASSKCSHEKHDAPKVLRLDHLHRVISKHGDTTPQTDEAPARSRSVDHLVGERKEFIRHGEAERFGDSTIVFDGGGLDRRLSVYRLPGTDWSRRLTLDHIVTFAGDADLPVYLRVTQSDGHQAWSSPIYLIA